MQPAHPTDPIHHQVAPPSGHQLPQQQEQPQPPGLPGVGAGFYTVGGAGYEGIGGAATAAHGNPQPSTPSVAHLPLPPSTGPPQPGMGASSAAAVAAGGMMHGVVAAGGGHQAWLPAAQQQHENRGATAPLAGGSAAGRSLKSRLVGPRPPDSAASMAALAAATSEMMGGVGMSGVGHQSGMALSVEGGGGAGGAGAGTHGLLEVDLGGRVMAHPVHMQMQMGGGGLPPPPAGGLGVVDGMVGSMESPGRAEQRRRR